MAFPPPSPPPPRRVPSSFNFSASAIDSFKSFPSPRLPSPSAAEVAGEEGFEPPLSGLETDGLPFNLLPFTLRGTQCLPRRVYPEHLPRGCPLRRFSALKLQPSPMFSSGSNPSTQLLSRE